MIPVAIIALLALVIGVPLFLVNRDIIRGGGRRRRHRRTSALPFLFFPTTGPTKSPPPVPAWQTRGAAPAEAARPVREPGIADLPLRPEPGFADLPPREPHSLAIDWDRTASSEGLADGEARQAEARLTRRD